MSAASKYGQTGSSSSNVKRIPAAIKMITASTRRIASSTRFRSGSGERLTSARAALGMNRWSGSTAV
jgi:hypothetical protein